MTIGFTPEERREWQQQTVRVLQQVERLCADHQITQDDLPAPSRRALRFLTAIRWDMLPERTPPAMGSVSPQNTAPRNAIFLKNAVAISRDLHRKMQTLAGKTQNLSALAALHAEIGTLADSMETLARQAGGSPADFPDATRRVYAWLRFLSDAVHLHAHVDTVRCFLSLWPETSPPKVDLFYTAVLYRWRKPRAGSLHITLSEGFVGAPPEILRALAGLMQPRPDPRCQQRARAWTEGGAYRDILQTLQTIAAGDGAHAQGQVYDLDALFDELNARYFNGALPRPHLTWNRRITRRKFGHYNPAANSIMLSSTLDDPAVPRVAVVFVLYHEMLHQFMGVENVKGRRRAHTAAFRRRERLFEQYAEAQAALRALALQED